MRNFRVVVNEELLFRVVGEEVVFVHVNDDRVVVLTGRVGVAFFEALRTLDFQGSIERVTEAFAVDRAVATATLAAIVDQLVSAGAVRLEDVPERSVPPPQLTGCGEFRAPEVTTLRLAELIPADLTVQGSSSSNCGEGTDGGGCDAEGGCGGCEGGGSGEGGSGEGCG